MSSPLSLGGISLEQHAGVTAALAEGFAVEEILAAEQLDPAVWRAGDVAWKQRLAQDAAAGAGVFTAHRLRVEEAEDSLSRAVSPLDDELDAWLSFLHAWSNSADPIGMLKKLGLGTNDISRLRRRWAKRMDDDPKLAIEAAKRAAAGAKPLPAVSVAIAMLKPFPWSKRRKAPAAAPIALAPGDAALADAYPLDRYARLAAELAALPKGRAQIFERYALDERSYAAVDAVWQAKLATDAALAADFRRLVGHHRARLDVAHRAAGGAARAPETARPTQAPIAVDVPAQPLTENLDETAFILAAIGDDVLPFQDDHGKAPPPLAKLGPSPDAGETSDAIPVFRDDPLALFGISAPRTVDETALFDAAALGDLDAPLPFQAAASVPVAAAGAPLFGGLTVQQLAAVAVELTIAPNARASILARYELSEETAQGAFQQLRASGDPFVRTAWNEAYAQYHAYRVRRR